MKELDGNILFLIGAAVGTVLGLLAGVLLVLALWSL